MQNHSLMAQFSLVLMDGRTPQTHKQVALIGSISRKQLLTAILVFVLQNLNLLNWDTVFCLSVVVFFLFALQFSLLCIYFSSMSFCCFYVPSNLSVKNHIGCLWPRAAG